MVCTTGYVSSLVPVISNLKIDSPSKLQPETGSIDIYWEQNITGNFEITVDGVSIAKRTDGNLMNVYTHRNLMPGTYTICVAGW